MKKVKIAVLLDINYTPETGGGFSYYDRLVHEIDSYDFSNDYDVCFVSANPSISGFNRNIVQLSHKICRFIPVKIYHFIYRALVNLPLIKILIRNRENKIYKKNDIRLIYNPIQMRTFVRNFPFIATSWDLGNYSTYAFPELVSEHDFNFRYRYCKKVLPKALMIFAESESGKAELMKFTQADEKRIKVLPLFAGNSINYISGEEQQYKFLTDNKLVKNRFFFYPAQFWAHKNHFGLIMAFSKFIMKNADYKLVLCGSDKGNKSYIKQVVSEMGLSESVLFTGFLSTEDVNTLYSNAAALTMASFLGPTNMPPLEAMELGCPVICSDLSGHREMLGDAAIYCNPMDYDDICRAMEELVKNRSNYQNRIIKQNENSVFKIEHSIRKLDEYFKEATTLLNCWQ